MIPPTFQIGDEVLITGPTEYGSEKRMGEKFKIETYHKEGPAFGGRDLYSGRGFPWYPASSLRLAPQFTIGNLVEVVRASNYDSRHLVGEKFTIDDIEGDRYTAVGYPWIRADCLRLVEELKIGDWVEVIGPAVGGSTAERGSIFQITQDKTMCTGLSTLGKAAYLPTSLRKLTPEEIKQHQTAQMLPKSTEIQELRRRIHDLEMSLNGFTNGPEPEHVPGISYVKDPIRDRLSAIEKRLDFVEKFQRGQEEFVRRWTAGP